MKWIFQILHIFIKKTYKDLLYRYCKSTMKFIQNNNPICMLKPKTVPLYHGCWKTITSCNRSYCAWTPPARKTYVFVVWQELVCLLHRKTFRRKSWCVYWFHEAAQFSSCRTVTVLLANSQTWQMLGSLSKHHLLDCQIDAPKIQGCSARFYKPSVKDDARHLYKLTKCWSS